jgi:hypothetical protein
MGPAGRGVGGKGRNRCSQWRARWCKSCCCPWIAVQGVALESAPGEVFPVPSSLNWESTSHSWQHSSFTALTTQQCSTIKFTSFPMSCIPVVLNWMNFCPPGAIFLVIMRWEELLLLSSSYAAKCPVMHRTAPDDKKSSGQACSQCWGLGTLTLGQWYPKELLVTVAMFYNLCYLIQ